MTIESGPAPLEKPGIPAGWENELDTERAKVAVRWFAIALLFGVMLYIRRHDAVIASNVSLTLMLQILTAAVGMTVLETLVLWKPGRSAIPPWFKYGTVFADMAFISLLIYYTGFTQSPFYFVYFVFLISNCLRYGMLMSLFVAATVNLQYVIVLGLSPEPFIKPSVLGGEGLKLLAFWAVALYGGAISARLRRQANQLRVYEETILELRREIGTRKTAAGREPTE